MRHVLSFLASLSSIFATPFVLMKTWSWFIATSFQCEVLSYIQCLGITLVLGAATIAVKLSDFYALKSMNEDEEMERFVWVILAPWVYLLISWLLSFLV